MRRPDVSPALNDFMANPENTMSKRICSSVFAALRTLEKNHPMPADLGSQERLNECVLQFVRDLVSENILSTDQAESFQIRLTKKASESVTPLDQGVLYDPKTKEEDQNAPITLSLNQVFVIVFTAMQDKSEKYWTSDYKTRLEKFYWINQELIEHPVCHSGFRNAWVIGMLYQDYLNLHFMIETSSHVEKLATAFLEAELSRVIREEPKKAYRIANQWLDRAQDTNNNGPKRPELDAFLDCEKDLRAFITGQILEMGLNPEDSRKNPQKPHERSLSEAIGDTLAAYESLPCPFPPGHEKPMQILSEMLKKKKQLPVELAQRFEQCEQLSDLTTQGLDMYRDCWYLRERAKSYYFLFPLGQEEGELVAYVQILISGLDKLLQDPKTPWAEHRATLKTCEEELEKRVEAFKKAHHYFDLIRNSFALLREIQNEADRKVFCRRISETLKKNHLIISDEMLTGDWYHACLQEEQGQSIFTFQQYDLNRLCWQALSTSPDTWSDAFRSILENIISLLEKPVENDPLHENLVRSSYPEEFIAQLKWLLSLSQMPLRFHDTAAFIPCCLEGVEVLASFDDFLRQLQKPNRDKWMLIRTLVFSENFARNTEVISKTLAEFPQKEWPAVLNCLLRSGHALPANEQRAIVEIVKLLSLNERWPFLSRLASWRFNMKNHYTTNTFLLLSPLLPPSQRIELFERLYTQTQSPSHLDLLLLKFLHDILLQLPEAHWERAFFSRSLRFSLLAPRPEEEDLGKFFNFLPKKRWPQFLAWFGEARKSLFQKRLASCLCDLRQGKRLPFIRALSPYLREIFPHSANPEFHSAFSEILPILEGDERAEFLNLVSQVWRAADFPLNSLISYLKLLEEQERWPFIRALSDRPWGVSALVLFEFLPKANWADLAEFSTIPQIFVWGKLDRFWQTVSPSQWQPLAHFFKTSVREILAQPKRCFEAFFWAPRKFWPEVIKASGENATWASLIPSCDRLCAILSSTPSNSVFKIQFLETIGPELNQLIQNKTDFLNLLKAMNEPFLSRIKLNYLQDFAQNFDRPLLALIPSWHLPDVLVKIASRIHCISDLVECLRVLPPENHDFFSGDSLSIS